MSAPENSARSALDHADVEAAYARWAPVYDAIFTAVMRPGRLAAAAAVAALTRARGPIDLLDVGVGTGLELPMFPKQARVTGVDLSEPMLAVARKRVAREGLTNVVDLIAMDAMALTFADESFDAVVAPYVITVVPDARRTLDEIARVLKPGGEIILVNHVSGEAGPIAFIERRLAKHADKLGWRPDFPWAIIGDWAAARDDIALIERRPLNPLGLFTLARLAKAGA